MKRRVCLIIAALAAMSCSSTKTPNGGTDGATGQQCLPSAACLSCIENFCYNQAMTTFGGGYMNNDFNGGQCPNLMACACTTNGNGNGNMDICVQQSGSGCTAAFTALTSCLNATACYDSACNGKGGSGENSGSGLTVGVNAVNFDNTEVGSTEDYCMSLSGSNASITLPQVLNDTGCATGGCAFSVQPLDCGAPNWCEFCVTFAPQRVGAVTGTLSIASGLTVALSGVGIASPLTGTGGSTSLATGGTMGTGGIVGSGGIIGTGGSTGTGGSLGTGGIVSTGGIVGSGGAISTGGTAASTSGPACPLGTWIADLGVICGATNAYLVLVVTQLATGRYAVTSTVGPISHHVLLTDEDSCQMMTLVSLSATYANGVLIFTFNPDSNTCAQKLTTSTMTINADCTQGSAKSVTAGCETCDTQGNCFGCGSMTCPDTGSYYMAVHSP